MAGNGSNQADRDNIQNQKTDVNIGLYNSITNVITTYTGYDGLTVIIIVIAILIFLYFVIKLKQSKNNNSSNNNRHGCENYNICECSECTEERLFLFDCAYQGVSSGDLDGEGSLQSSGGSAIGIGSDIRGSIGMPCFFNGIFGHRATTGVINNSGQFPCAKAGAVNFLGTGPMCRFACDLMPTFRILASPDFQEQLKLDEQGSDIAGNCVMDMVIMGPAKVVLCDPYRVLADIRFNVLQEGKTLVVSSPRLKSGMLRHIVPAEGASSTELKECARTTSSKCGVTVDFDQQLHIDVVILSSVVARSSGRRIGRADLFAELEYALLASLRMVDDLTTVLAIVRDLQVMKLDDDQFGPHDVKVDYIVTPTQIIECQVGERLLPTSVLWSALNPECLDVLPLLKVFRQRDWKAKRNVCFAGEAVVLEQGSDYYLGGSLECLKKGGHLAKGKSKRKKRNVQSRSEDRITCREDSSDETKKLDIQGKSVSENDAVGRPFQKRMTPNRRRNGRKSTLGSEDQVRDNHLSERDTSTHPAEGKKTKFQMDQSQLPALYIGGLVRNLRTWELRRLEKDHESADHLEKLGCPVKKVSLTKMKYSFQFWVSMMSNSADETFCNLLGNLKKPINPYVELLYWLAQFPRHTLPAIGLGIGEKLCRPQEHDTKLKSLCESLSKEFQDLLGGDGVFLYPTHRIPAPFHIKPLFVFFNFAYTGIFSILGLPATAVSMGMCIEEVPIGIQVVGGEVF